MIKLRNLPPFPQHAWNFHLEPFAPPMEVNLLSNGYPITIIHVKHPILPIQTYMTISV
jgi:hypothetical protein